ncbi:putative nicotinamide N-methyase [Hoeflea marina]|uniref:Putative nicotinamide N-methyase n=1 Tax=Hoeflea marina TaxID=274592 RepID=A0A317PJ48_9HYPH|nr:methyltransferase [Hoeflea marina]PWV98253.1 putative nicotinamide N-methyase [Hoeflea marina]
MKTPPLDFIRANTALGAPPHVPEIRLHLADEAHELWHKTEEELDSLGLPPPFWAFAWAGGQGLARHILDNPALVAGLRVLDFATGSGLVAIAAARAGAARVEAADIDGWAVVAAGLNARENDAAVEVLLADVVGTDAGWDVVLAGDVFYDRAMAERLAPWFSRLVERGAAVIVGDPGRAYCPSAEMTLLGTYMVPVTRVLEDREVKRTSVWQFGG